MLNKKYPVFFIKIRKEQKMPRMKAYIYIMAFAIVVVALGFLMNISQIKSFSLLCWELAQQNSLSVTAAVCAFLCLGRSNYWTVIAGCAVITALVIQFAIIGHNAAVLTWAARIVTFMAIVFVMDFARLVINR